MSQPPPALEPRRTAPSTSVALEAVRRELADFPTWHDAGRLEVIPTAACNLRCTYCAVDLGPRSSPPQVLDGAVDLLLRSSREAVELQFFGGEPLLKRAEVMRTIERGARLAAERGKRLSFVITTNGLLLDEELLAFLAGFEVKVMFSLDGPAAVSDRYRPLARADRQGVQDGSGPTLEKNLRMLLRSGVDCFVNMVVTPEAVDDLVPRFRWVLSQGARTVQVMYALAPGWTEQAQQGYCDGLRQCAELCALPGPPRRLQNIGSAAEPTVLSNDLIVDVDGTIYDDIALFGEVQLPGLRTAMRVGEVGEVGDVDRLRRSREQNLLTLREVFPDERSAPRRLVEEQVQIGRRVQEAMARLEGLSQQRDHNPLQRTVLRRSLRRQAQIMARRPELLQLPILMLENACCHQCVFCLAKPLPPTPLGRVRAWLADNRSHALGLCRLGLGGNEPLAHPEIDAILDAACDAGFSELEALTVGAPVADPTRARQLFERGVRGYAIPLYAADAPTHDEITQTPGSHAETLRAIGTLRELGATVHVHTNALQQNLGALPELSRLVREDWGLPFCIIPVRPKASNLPYADLVPRYDEVVAQCSDGGLVGFPLCVARRVQDPPRPDGAIISDVLKVYVLDQPFWKPPKCEGCRWASSCGGTFEAYVNRYGDDELVPP